MNTATTDTPNIAALRAWGMAAASGTHARAQMTATDATEFWGLYESAFKLMRWLIGKGIPAQIAGAGDVRKNGFAVVSNRVAITINPPSPTKKGVTATSREAYLAVDVNNQCAQVVAAVVDLHQAGEVWVSDSLVAKSLDMPAARVSARRNEIERFGTVKIGEHGYKFTPSPERIKCRVTGSSVNGWAMRRVMEQPTLF